MLIGKRSGLVLRALAFLLLSFSASADSLMLHNAGDLKQGVPPKRIVALNWWLAEHLLALGVTPIGVAEIDRYRQWVVEPKAPESIKSVGRRQAPNLEAIRSLKPDLILVSGHLEAAVPAFRAIAPTLVQTTYESGSNPWVKAREHLLTLGKILDLEDKARAVIAQAEQDLAATREQLLKAGLAGNTAFIVRFLDDRRVRVHGANSMLNQALEQAGLTNAWHRPTNLWGFTPGTIADLGGQPDAWLIYIRPWPEADRERLQESGLWPYLPMARSGRIIGVGPVWTFGGVVSVPRMARMLADQLLQGAQEQQP